jgi:hypothetical protein
MLMLQGLRYTQQYWWTLTSSGAWCCVTRHVFPHILKDCNAVIFTVRQSKRTTSSWGWSHYEPFKCKSYSSNDRSPPRRSESSGKCYSKVSLSHTHIMKADTCVGKVGSSWQYDHRLAVSQSVGRNFQGTCSRQYIWGEDPCRSSLEWPRSSVRAKEQKGSHYICIATNSRDLLMLAACTACAKTYFTAPRKYCENEERYRDTKCQTYPRVFNMGHIKYPADAPAV